MHDTKLLAHYWQQITSGAAALWSARHHSAMAVRLLQPQLGGKLQSRWIAPIAFVGACLALVALLGAGLVGGALVLLSAGLIVAILEHVFGLQLGIHVPSASV